MEFPQINKVYGKLKDQGFQIIGIDAMNMTDQSKKFLEENKIDFPCFENGKEGEGVVTAEIFGVGIFPTSMVVDKEGKVRHVHIGFDDGDEVKLEKEILALLAE